MRELLSSPMTELASADESNDDEPASKLIEKTEEILSETTDTDGDEIEECFPNIQTKSDDIPQQIASPISLTISKTQNDLKQTQEKKTLGDVKDSTVYVCMTHGKPQRTAATSGAVSKSKRIGNAPIFSSDDQGTDFWISFVLCFLVHAYQSISDHVQRNSIKWRKVSKAIKHRHQSAQHLLSRLMRRRTNLARYPYLNPKH